MKNNLSIITIAFNNLDELKETLDSIDNQEIKPYENILVLSSFSEKDKKDLLSRYSCDYRKFFWDLDCSLFNAMNIGIQKSMGDFLLFLNAGDYLIDSNRISLIIDLLAKDTCISFKTHQIYDNIIIVRDNKPSGNIFSFGAKTSIPPHQGFIAPNHKEIFFNEDLRVSADNDWMLRNSYEYGLRYSDSVLANFKLGGQSTYPTISIILVKLKHEKFIRFIIECLKYLYSLFVSQKIYFITMAKLRGYNIFRK